MSHEFRTAQQQVKKMTQARAKGSAIINEYESDKTIPNEAILTATDVEKSFLERNKEGGKQGAVSIRRKSINDGTAIFPRRRSVPSTSFPIGYRRNVQETAKYQDEEEAEQRKDRGQEQRMHSM